MTTTEIQHRATAPTHWSVDPDQTSVDFAVKTFWGLSTVHGRFDRFRGSYKSGPYGTKIELTIDADSVDTGNATRDKHLRSTGVTAGDPELLALNRTSRGLRLHTAASLFVLLILIDMIWKPGA